MQLYFNNPYTDPDFNMALEEFLFLNYNEPLFHIWQNEPCVVIGKNQLLEAELDAVYLKENNIKTVRRFSGGGAVYQDLGNVNLSFMNSSNFFDFDSYNVQIMRFLETLDLHPTTNDRRAIFVNNHKISGSSQHIRSSKSLYHATLLFDANLDHLELSLQGDETIEFTAKHVKSVRSPVSNLKNHFSKAYNLLDFKRDILQYFTDLNSKEITLSDYDLTEIKRLKTTKYKCENWLQNGRYK